jgi:hypothetical protein
MMLSCSLCGKIYKYKGAFEKHVLACTNATVTAGVRMDNEVNANHCGKVYSRLSWFTRHLDSCAQLLKGSEPSLQAVFYFSDDFFELASNNPLPSECPFDSNYVFELSNFCSTHSTRFKILHLNINSLFLKFAELNVILDINCFDIIMLNETKIDASVPNSAFVNANYSLIRRDRDTHGGGVLIFIKKHLKNLNSSTATDFELISIQLHLNGQPCNFISSYKPPSLSAEEYLGFLHTFLLNLDLTLPTYLLGDLNMNLLNSNYTGQALLNIIKELNLVQAVSVPTRIAAKQCGSALVTTQSLIDVVLHNNLCDIDTLVVGCPFSDHMFVAAAIECRPTVTKDPLVFYRCLSDAYLELIVQELNKVSFDLANSISDVHDRWNY